MSPPPCEACGCCSHRSFAQLDERTAILRCTRCDLNVVDPMPQWQEAKDDFAALELGNWIHYMEGFRRKQYRRDIEVIRKHQPSGRVLDIGCSTGFFLDEIRSQGFKPRGVEASTTAAEYAITELGLDVTQGEFESIDIEAESFDVVTLFAVLEHMAHPAAVIKRALRTLKPGGMLVVKVPRKDSLVAHLIYGAYKFTGGRVVSPLRSLYDWDYQYPHLYHFSTASLKRLLRSAGLTILSHRAESSINLAEFDSRLDLTGDEDRQDLGWARGGVVRWSISTVIHFANLTGWADDLIVYARK